MLLSRLLRALRAPSLVAVVSFAFATAAHAGERCQPPDEEGNVYCEVGIPSERLGPVSAEQKMSQWCWAAAISSIFGYHGHPVAQERIVAAVWGRLVDLPAMSGGMMTESLARPWTDDRGRPFRARVRVYDAAAGEFGVDEAMVIDELRDERPLLVGTVGHAMVMTALAFVRDPWGGEHIVSIIVRDPWPGSGQPSGPSALGRRELRWEEMDPQYVATVDIPRKKPRADLDREPDER